VLCGHSLGGAVATLVAAQVSWEATRATPVRCVAPAGLVGVGAGASIDSMGLLSPQ
jgi:alpha-beta hydrolase superfamily lysophospholipase